MIRLVECSCNPLMTSNLPRVKVRVATVSRATHLRYRYVRIYVDLRRLVTLDISGMCASDFRRNDPVIHVDNHVVPHLQCHNRIRSPIKSLVLVPTCYYFEVVRIPYGRRAGLCHPSLGHTGVHWLYYAVSVTDP